MQTFNFIDFHRTRDFSTKMNATFEFIKQNYLALGKSILVIAGPPVLVASMIIGSFFGDFLRLTQAAATGMGSADELEAYVTSVSFWLQMGLAMIFFIMSSVMTIATVNNYLLLYADKRSNKIEVNEVWTRVRETFWMYLRTMILFFIVFFAVYILMIIPVVLVAQISPVLIFFAIIFLFCGLIYVMVSISLIFIVRAYEKKGFFESLGRSFRLVQGKWWSTFGLIMILYFIMMIISYIPMIPWYAVTLANSIHNTSTDTFQEPSSTWGVMTIVFFTLYYMIQMVLASLPNIGIAFQYFNLVELKESKGLLQQIDSFGEPKPPTSSPEEQY